MTSPSEQDILDSCKYMRDDGPMPRPATGKTPVRNLRVPDSIWVPALKKARAEGRTLTEVITAYLRRYIAAPPRGTAKEDDPDDR